MGARERGKKERERAEKEKNSREKKEKTKKTHCVVSATTKLGPLKSHFSWKRSADQPSFDVWIRPPLLSLLRSRRCRRLRRGSPRGRPWGPFGGGEAEEERRWRFWTFEKEAGGGEELARYMTKTKTTGRRRGSGRASGAPRSLLCARKRTSLSSWCALSEREGVERERESERARERDERASEFSRSYLLKKAKKKFSFDARGNEQTITNQRFRRSNARTRSLCLSVSSLSLFLV